MPPRVGDLEESLMDAMEGDDRFGSGTPDRESDNVLDFVQMSGLAGQAAPTSEDDQMPVSHEDEPPLMDLVSFLEEGVGDVDDSMDPIPPIVPELQVDARASSAQDFDESFSDSVQGLKEIISELTRESSESEDLDPAPKFFESSATASSSEEPPQRSEDNELDLGVPNVSAIGASAGPMPVDDPGQLYFGADTEEALPAMQAETTSAIEIGPVETSASADLAEAKALLDRLDLSEMLTDAPTTTSKPGTPNPLPDTRAVAEEVTYEDETQRTPHRRSLHRRRRRIRRWFVRFIMLAVIFGAGYAAVQFFLNQTETPEAAYQAAERLLGEGKYAHASNAFQAFTRRFPMEIRRSDAMFMAGYAMQLAPPEPHENARSAYEEALVLLERFVVENPSHTKTARAETLMAVLYFKLGHYSESIKILGNPDRRLRDPGAYLTSMRTLGRAYAATSRIENARSAFMRAASLEENISPDLDYAELGQLYQKLAERSGEEEEKRRYQELAIEQWDYALRVPGLLKRRKDGLKLLRDVVTSRLEGNPGELDTDARASSLPAARTVQGGSDEENEPLQPKDFSTESS